jgi:hypothetical protein
MTSRPPSHTTSAPHSSSSPIPTDGDYSGVVGSDIARSWFSALDRRHFGVGANRWTVRVTGIHVVGQDVWIQVQCARNKLRSCTVRLTLATSLLDGLRTLERTIEQCETN